MHKMGNGDPHLNNQALITCSVFEILSGLPPKLNLSMLQDPRSGQFAGAPRGSPHVSIWKVALGHLQFPFLAFAAGNFWDFRAIPIDSSSFPTWCVLHESAFLLSTVRTSVQTASGRHKGAGRCLPLGKMVISRLRASVAEAQVHCQAAHPPSPTSTDSFAWSRWSWSRVGCTEIRNRQNPFAFPSSLAGDL